MLTYVVGLLRFTSGLLVYSVLTTVALALLPPKSTALPPKPEKSPYGAVFYSNSVIAVRLAPITFPIFLDPLNNLISGRLETLYPSEIFENLSTSIY